MWCSLVDGGEGGDKEASTQRGRGCHVDFGHLHLDILGHAGKPLPGGSQVLAGRAPWSKAVNGGRNICLAQLPMSHRRRKGMSGISENERTSLPAGESRRTTPLYVTSGAAGFHVGRDYSEPPFRTHNSIIHSPWSIRCQLSSSNSINLPPGCSPDCAAAVDCAVAASRSSAAHVAATKYDVLCMW